MKKLLNVLCAFAMVAITLTGCSKSDSPAENQDQQVGAKKTIVFNALPGSTKTHFGDKSGSQYPTVWTDAQQVTISMNLKTTSGQFVAAADVTPKSGGQSASFAAELTDDESGAYKFYALSPASSYVGLAPTQKRLQLNFPNSQAPTQTSVDEAAHIMVARSTEYSVFPENVNLSFTHIAAYGKFQLINFNETARISSISLESAEPFAGRYYLYVEDYEEHSAFELLPNTTSNTLTINLPGLYTESEWNYDKVFWFSCAPVDLRGKTLKFTINTDVGKYVKTVTFPSDKGNFQSGRVASFNLDMTGIAPSTDEVYTLVTDYDDFIEDSKVILVALDDNYAMSTTQNTNNRASVSIIKEGTDPSTIKNPEDAGAQVFILEAGTVDNTVSFKCVNGTLANNYIGSPGTNNNYLKTFDATSNNTSFSIELQSDGSAILKTNGTNDNIYMRFNASSSNIFSLYKAESSVTGKVAIYKLNGSGEGEKLIHPKTADPVITYESSTKTVTITCSTPGAKIGYSVDGSDPGLDGGGDPLPGTYEYTAPFVITSTTTVKAFAGAPDMEMSNIVSKECEVGTDITYIKATSITSGKAYLIVASSAKAAKAITSNYGYLQVEDVTVTGDAITLTSAAKEFVFTAGTNPGEYTIKQSDDRYLYQTGTYNSFNVSATPSEGQYWTVSFNAAGEATITNVLKNKWIQYSTSHTSYGSYATAQSDGVLPVLYERQ